MTEYIVKNISHYCNVRLNKCPAIPSFSISYYDFTFVLSGSMTYLCDGKVYVLNKNDAIFIPPGSVRERIEGEKPVHFVSFNFTVNHECTLSFPPYMKNCITTDIRKLVSVFSPAHITQHYHSKEKLANILNYILLELSDMQTIDTKNDHIIKIIRYIDEHITESITLSSISEEINLSREYISAIFKKEMKTTLTEYINKQKIRLAKDIISGNHMELRDVAEYVGYNNYNYFSRLFKKYYDITPIELKSRKNRL